MIEAVLFDLDDTLYVEGDFFRSGFGAVARHLESRGAGDAQELARELLAIHDGEGRERVLDKLMSRRGLPAEWVPELVQRFRGHRPEIALAPEVGPVLRRLRGRYKLGCVTDGWPDVQRRKVETLGLESTLDAVVYTGDFDRDEWKPSALPFQVCCTRLGVRPAEAVSVGDNPERDMRGARRAGITSVRIRREGGYFHDAPSDGDPADFEIRSLEQLESVLAGFERSEG